MGLSNDKKNEKQHQRLRLGTRHAWAYAWPPPHAYAYAYTHAYAHPPRPRLRPRLHLTPTPTPLPTHTHAYARPAPQTTPSTRPHTKHAHTKAPAPHTHTHTHTRTDAQALLQYTHTDCWSSTRASCHHKRERAPRSRRNSHGRKHLLVSQPSKFGALQQLHVTKATRFFDAQSERCCTVVVAGDLYTGCAAAANTCIITGRPAAKLRGRRSLAARDLGRRRAATRNQLQICAQLMATTNPVHSTTSPRNQIDAPSIPTLGPYGCRRMCL